MAFVPDGGRGLSQMRVIAEDGQAGGRHGAIDRPVIAAAQHAKAAQHFQLFVLLKHSQVDARIGYAGWHNQGVAWVVAGFQLRGAFWSQLRDEVRAYDFRLPVAAQVPSHHLGPLDGIGNLPGFGFETQDSEFDREVVLALLDGGVDAARVGFEDAPAVRRQRLEGRGRRAMHSQAARKAVGFERDFAEDLAQPPRSDAPVEFHLPQAFLSMNISLRVVHIVFVLRIDMRYAVAVGDYFDRLVQARYTYFALISGNRTAHQNIIRSPGQPYHARRCRDCLLPPGHHRSPSLKSIMGMFALCQCSTVYKYSHFEQATASMIFR